MRKKQPSLLHIALLAAVFCILTLLIPGKEAAAAQSTQDCLDMLNKFSAEECQKKFVDLERMNITEAEYQEIAAKALELTNGITKTYEKIQTIYNYVSWEKGIKSDTAPGQVPTDPYPYFLYRNVSKNNVCQGYANLFRTMMKALGIPCITAHGFRGEGHGWDFVLYEGKWGIADCAMHTLSIDTPEKDADLYDTYSLDVDLYSDAEFNYSFYYGGLGITGYKGSSSEIKLPSVYHDQSHNQDMTIVSIRPDVFSTASAAKITLPDTITGGILINKNGTPELFTSSHLKEIEVAANNTAFASYKGVLYNKDCSKIICIPRGMEDLELAPIKAMDKDSLPFSSFPYTNLYRVKIGNGTTTIGSDVFQNCPSIEAIYIPDSVTDIDSKAIPDSLKPTVYASTGSAGAEFAKNRGLTLKSLEEYGSYIPKADYSEVDRLLEVAYTYTQSKGEYTQESILTLSDAIAKVVRGLPVTRQKEVDAMAKAIEDAIKNLKPASSSGTTGADYSKVDEALKKVPEDLSVYTDDSAKALQQAVANVKRGLDASHQQEVDAMANAIENAVKNLKLADPSGGGSSGGDSSKDPQDQVQSTQKCLQMMTDLGEDGWKQFISLEPMNITPEEFATIKTKAEEVTSGKTKDSDKIQAVYDYIIEFQPSKAGYPSNPNDPYQMLLYKRGRCQGFANLFRTMMTALDIPCVIAHGLYLNVNGNAPGHAWNFVLSDGAWGIVDSALPGGKDEFYLGNDVTRGYLYYDTYWIESPLYSDETFDYSYYYGDLGVTGYHGTASEITLPESFKAGDTEMPITGLNVDSFSNASLTKITIPKTITKGFSINGPSNPEFFKSKLLKEIVVDQDNPDYASYKGVLYNKDFSKIISVPLGMEELELYPMESFDKDSFPAGNGQNSFPNLSRLKVAEGTKSVGSYSFEYFPSLTDVYIPDSVQTIEPPIFGENVNPNIYASKNSAAAKYAEEQGMTVKEPSEYESQEPPKEDPPKEDPPKEDPPKVDPPKEDPPKEDPPKNTPTDQNQTNTSPKTDDVVLSKVTGLRVVYKGKKARLTWKKVKGAAGYNVYRYQKKKWVKVKSIKKKTNFTVKRNAKKTFKYRICAFKKTGGKTFTGAYSKTIKVKRK